MTKEEFLNVKRLWRTVPIMLPNIYYISLKGNFNKKYLLTPQLQATATAKVFINTNFVFRTQTLKAEVPSRL